MTSAFRSALLLPRVLVAWACLITPAVATATDYYVHAGVGSNSNSGTQPGAAWADLEYALTQLRAGDRLHLRSGTYKKLHKIGELSNGTRENPITLQPYQNEKPIISSDQRFWLLNNKWWVIDNLTFQGSDEMTLGQQPTPGTCNSFATDIVIKNNRFQHSSEHGMTLRCAKRVTVVGNTFDNIRSRKANLDRLAIVLQSHNEDILIASNHFRDIGADGIQIGPHYARNVTISANTFEVVRPYVYRDLDGKVVAQSGRQKFGNVGENAIDIKGGPGPIDITDNVMKGFRAKVSGQDSSGSMGPAVVVHFDAAGVNLRRNRFSDSIFHIRVVGDHAKNSMPDRNVEISNNFFEDVTPYDGTGQVPTGLDIGNVTNVRVFHNNFYNLQGEGKRLLRTYELRDAAIQNNLFYNGTVEIGEPSSDINVATGHNAWSRVTEVPPVLAGPNDLRPDDPGINWSNGELTANSPLIDAGMYINESLYTGSVSGSAPDIGVLGVDLGGRVQTADGSDVCALVLASGDFTFSCDPIGVFSLGQLTREKDGTVKRQVYAEGFFPRADTLYGPTSETVILERSGVCPDYNNPYSASENPESSGRRHGISGRVLVQATDTPVCALVIANGEHMFSCDDTGSYALDIPLDSKGQYKLQVYAEGHAPAVEVFDEFSGGGDVRMAVASECR